MANVPLPQADLPRDGAGFLYSGGADSGGAEPIIDADYFAAPESKFKRWDGAAWVSAAIKRWDGTAWVSASIKRWDGTDWVIV